MNDGLTSSAILPSADGTRMTSGRFQGQLYVVEWGHVKPVLGPVVVLVADEQRAPRRARLVLPVRPGGEIRGMAVSHGDDCWRGRRLCAGGFC